MRPSRFLLPILLPFGSVYVLSQSLEVNFVRDPPGLNLLGSTSDLKYQKYNRLINSAVKTANQMLEHMMLVIELRKHRETSKVLVEAAFGPSDIQAIRVIRHNIKAIKSATIEITVGARSILGTDVEYIHPADPNEPGYLVFSEQFFNPPFTTMKRAATLIRQAAYIVNGATDDVVTSPGVWPEKIEMHHAHLPVPDGMQLHPLKLESVVGFPKTVDEVRRLKFWKYGTEKAHNMDQCAVAYMIFALLCENDRAELLRTLPPVQPDGNGDNHRNHRGRQATRVINRSHYT